MSASNYSSNDEPGKRGICLRHCRGAFNYLGSQKRLHKGVTFLIDQRRMREHFGSQTKPTAGARDVHIFEYRQLVGEDWAT